MPSRSLQLRVQLLVECLYRALAFAARPWYFSRNFEALVASQAFVCCAAFSAAIVAHCHARQPSGRSARLACRRLAVAFRRLAVAGFARARRAFAYASLKLIFILRRALEARRVERPSPLSA